MFLFHSRAHILRVFLLTCATVSTSCAAVVAERLPSLTARADVNLTLLNNATAIVQSLDYTSNCTLSILWYKNLPTTGSGAGSSNDSINIDFLRSALPTEYQNDSDAALASFYDDMSNGTLSTLGWIDSAKDDIETSCITPEFEKQITLTDLNPRQNCTATAIFLSSLGWITDINLTGAQNYTASSANDTSWLEFLRASLPENDRNNLTDLELLVYRNFFLASEDTQKIQDFLLDGFDSCQKDICEVQGYTGNPDIGGIGVISSYTVEAILVTLYFVAINFQLWWEGANKNGQPSKDKISPRIKKALEKASDELADGALFFSLSISTAGWVSFVNGTSYYEKLVFTSANVLALSALFAFLGMFTKEGREKRGEYILAVMIAGILTESAIQYIVYLKEPNERYSDYQCLHLQFTDEGYHPTIFEALFFLLLGLSVIAGIVGLVWLSTRPKSPETGTTRSTSYHSDATVRVLGTKQKIRAAKIEKWVIGTRIFIQTVAITVMWVELVYLWKIRKIMSRIAGATWSEGNWGFGQILALFIWLPPIIDILGWLFLPEEWLGGKPKKCACEKEGHECTCSTPHVGNDKDQKSTASGSSSAVKNEKMDVVEFPVDATTDNPGVRERTNAAVPPDTAPQQS